MNYQVLYKNLYDPSIILLHKGRVSYDLISIVMETLEASVEGMENDRSVKKKFNNIITESFQNISFHSEKREDDFHNSDLIMVLSKKFYYKIVTGNLVETSEVENLSSQLERINQMDKAELRSYYKEVMSQEGYSDKGTAGLGFIDMARKTGQKLEFRFHPMDEKYSYFTFEIKVKK